MQLKLETCAGVLGHWHRPQRDDKSSRPAHIRPMAKSPDSRKGKDPARPTRAKAAREPLAPIAPALEQLLNPGIAKGTAGVGSGTGLKPPPDNSWDRREDFSAAHRARKSTREGAQVTPLSNSPPQAGERDERP